MLVSSGLASIQELCKNVMRIQISFIRNRKRRRSSPEAHPRGRGIAHLPMPDDPELRQAALAAGLLGPDMIGLTLGYGVYVCVGHATIRVMSQEFRHVHQYEQAGSIAAYLPIYVRQIVMVGYHDAPLEIDARVHERDHADPPSR